MHWDLLELDRKTATERDVKRAYAKKLKTTRPDKDPEAFQKLRQAYEWALGELQWARMEAEEDEEPQALEPASGLGLELSDAPALTEDPLQASPIARGGSDTEAFQAELDALEEALENDGDVAEAVRAFEGALYLRADLVEPWGEAFAKLVEEYPENADLRLRSETILFELEHEGCRATQAIINRANNEMDGDRIGNLAGLFRKNISRISTHAGSQAVCQLASAAALWSPLHARPLMDKAFEILPTQWRDHAITAIEQDVMLGGLLNAIRADQRKFWADRLQNPYAEWDWESEESVKAIDYIAKNAVWSWKGIDMILQTVPEDAAKRIQRRLRTVPQPKAAYQGDSGSSGSGINGRLIFFVVFIIAQICMAATRCSSDYSTDYNSSDPPQIIPLDQFQKWEDDGRVFTPEELRKRLNIPDTLEPPPAGEGAGDPIDLNRLYRVDPSKPTPQLPVVPPSNPLLPE